MRVLGEITSRPARLGVLAGLVTVLVLLLVVASRPLGAPGTRAGKVGAPGGSGTDRGSTETTSADPVPDDALLPNLVVLPAEELGITGRDGRVLRFATVLANVGAGPLQVDPREELLCPHGQRYVEQSAFVDADADDEYVRSRDRARVGLPGGCMLFHPRHEHWHFDSTAAYSLTTVGDPTAIVSRDKVSFCLRDSERLAAAATRHRRTYGECARDRRQGLTVGWADRYDADLTGQRLRLPVGLGDGVFCLRLQVDPFGLLHESREDDNTSATPIRIRGRDVARAAGTC